MPWAEDNLILKAMGGSRAYGLATEGSDLDMRGVAMPPVEWLVGFSPSEHAMTAEVKTGGSDIVVHALGKFCRLALGANPNMYDILFCRDEDVLFARDAGMALRELREAFLSRLARKTFVGYAMDQLKRVRNHNTDHGTHGYLVEQYGYDTKNAMHLVRLLRMGLEILRDGKVNVYRADREYLLGIRNGSLGYGELVEMAESMIADCDAAVASSVLPEQPDRKRVERFLMGVQAHWITGGTAQSAALTPTTPRR